jgi:hypothetical protein
MKTPSSLHIQKKQHRLKSSAAQQGVSSTQHRLVHQPFYAGHARSIFNEDAVLPASAAEAVPKQYREWV